MIEFVFNGVQLGFPCEFGMEIQRHEFFSAELMNINFENMNCSILNTDFVVDLNCICISSCYIPINNNNEHNKNGLHPHRHRHDNNDNNNSENAITLE